MTLSGDIKTSVTSGRPLKADTLVLLLLAAWWVLNLLQAAFMDLANDEAYYWYFSKHLDWGYYDHPPMVALLVWLSAWLPGTLGVRLATTLLQPLYLLLFWHLIRPADASRRDAAIYLLLCFSQPLLQLYGFLALPDAPLMMTTVLFLWAYKRLCVKVNVPNALLLGLTVALLGYSKYHGALVVMLVVLSNPKLLLRWQLWLAAVVCLVLYAPHLWWQYTHDWVSFRYHLSDRAADAYRVNYTLEYLATALVVFNPLWLWHLVKGFRQSHGDFNRALRFLLVGFLLFFLLSTLRGPVQPQWILPVVFPFIALTFQAVRRTRYARVVGLVFFAIFLVVRVIVVANPFGFKGELWEQRELYTSIARLADGRPVQFMHTYTAPPKYTFYTGGEAYCAPYYFNRHSQWQYDTSDRAFTGREVIVGNFTNWHPDKLTLPNGKPFYYSVISDFHPLREVTIAAVEPIDARLPILRSSKGTDSLGALHLTLAVTNPYPYDIYSTDSLPLRLTIFFNEARYTAAGGSCPLTDTLRAGSTTRIECDMRMGRPPVDGTMPSGFCLARGSQPTDNSHRLPATVCRTDDYVTIARPADND